MNEITIDHVRQAAEWAKKADEPLPIDGLVRKYYQDNWDCGTSCCMWGAASIISGNGPADRGPTAQWASQTHLHAAAAGLMNSCSSRPDQMISLLTGANLTGANLTGANLRGADLRGADLRGADLSGASLTGADLSGASLTGANLTGANMRGADLTGADLRGADLRGADLRGTDLSGASLTGANLTGAKILFVNVYAVIK